MITILDVAKEARVSAATVSRVLNNKGGISQSTVEQVYKAVDKLGYEPNILAQSLRKKETRTILVLVPNISNPYYAHILSGVSDTTRALGYSSFICNTRGEPEQEKEVLDLLAKRRADGAILLASELGCDWLLEYAEKYPIVQCSEFDPNVKIPHVSIDNYQAARDAVRFLIELGHKRIGTISSTNHYLSTHLRLKGYRDELTEAGLPVVESNICYADRDYNFKSGKRAAQAVLAQENRPTALFCISDVLAQGAIVGAKEMGFDVPRDLAVVGFDDVEQTTIYHPYITTIAQPCYEIGKTGTEMLCQYLLGQQDGTPPHPSFAWEVILPHKLVVRESTAKRTNLLDFPVY